MNSEVKKNENRNIYLEKPWLKFYPEGLAANVDIPNISVVEAFDDAVMKWKNKTAIVFYGKKLDYVEIGDKVDRFATALCELGVKKGDKVALYMLNCPQFLIAYFAALKAGAVLTTISPVYVTVEIKHQLEDSGAETLICQDIL